MAGRPHRRANLHSVAMTMTRPRVATEAPWRQRFHTTRLGFPSWARDHPDRIVYISNESGKFEVYTWDRRAGARRQLTDRPEGTGFRVPPRLDPSGEHVFSRAARAPRSPLTSPRRTAAGSPSVDRSPSSVARAATRARRSTSCRTALRRGESTHTHRARTSPTSRATRRSSRSRTASTATAGTRRCA